MIQPKELTLTEEELRNSTENLRNAFCAWVVSNARYGKRLTPEVTLTVENPEDIKTAGKMLIKARMVFNHTSLLDDEVRQETPCINIFIF
ncbi:hypothetical protein LCGC14_1923180 [marine sediment metagenome]|uniref:Uncharacterized protein n=1 Tax=marine sediment metagenome TaxID=412755 RepID=A0A0F9IMZ0_9ZZZZ